MTTIWFGPRYFVKDSQLVSFFYSTSHKTIGILYLMFGIRGGIAGSACSGIIRIELGRPGQLLGDDQIYNSIVTLHAFLIIFFIVIPILIGGFGNWFLPIMLGSPDISFPRLNNFSLWLVTPALFLILFSQTIESGVGTGNYSIVQWQQYGLVQDIL